MSKGRDSRSEWLVARDEIDAEFGYRWVHQRVSLARDMALARPPETFKMREAGSAFLVLGAWCLVEAKSAWEEPCLL